MNKYIYPLLFSMLLILICAPLFIPIVEGQQVRYRDQQFYDWLKEHITSEVNRTIAAIPNAIEQSSTPLPLESIRLVVTATGDTDNQTWNLIVVPYPQTPIVCSWRTYGGARLYSQSTLSAQFHGTPSRNDLVEVECNGHFGGNAITYWEF